MKRIEILSAGVVTLAVLNTSAVAQPNRGAPTGVVAHRNLEYIPKGHESHKLDIFVPKDASGSLPLIVWVHGGGWQNGSKDGCPPLRKGYVQRGYAVAAINYRLSGHATFPAQIQDCKAAIRWLRANADRYGIDPERIGVWGSSAGGHLVALLGTSGDVEEFDVGENLDQSSRVQAVCDYYGPTDFKAFVTTPRYESHASETSPEGKLIGGAVLKNEEKARRVNPIEYVSEDEPPFLIVHGDEDRTVPLNQSALLYEALKKAGRDVRFHTIHGAGHGRPGFGAPEIENMVQKFFDAKLKSKSVSTPKAVATESAVSEADRKAAERGRPNRKRGRITFNQVLSRNDKDKDGKLSREEFPGGKALYERMDRNKDGFVTREEHEKTFGPDKGR